MNMVPVCCKQYNSSIGIYTHMIVERAPLPTRRQCLKAVAQLNARKRLGAYFCRFYTTVPPPCRQYSVFFVKVLFITFPADVGYN